MAESRTVKFEPLSRFNGYETYGTAGAFYNTIYMWNREVSDTTDRFYVTLSLNQPAEGDEVCKVAFSGTAGHNVHYTCSAGFNASFNVDGIVTWDAGEITKTFAVLPIEQSSWFVQKDLLLVISRAATLVPSDVDDPNKRRYITKNLNIDDERDIAKVTLYPTMNPPVICVSSVSGTVSTPGDQLSFIVSADQTLAQDVDIYYKLEGDLSGSLSGPGQGTVTIPAGDFSSTVTLEYSSVGTGDCSVILDYERNTVKYVTKDFDNDIPLVNVSGNGSACWNIDTNIHLDQNMEIHTNDLALSGLELESKQDKPYFTAVPSVIVHGGTEPKAGYEGEYLWDFVEQTNTTKVTDPVTGNELKYFSPSQACEISTPYLRESFNNAFCGGNRLNVPARRWNRYSIRVEPLIGTDASLNSEFISLTTRVRLRDRNHGVVFRMRNLSEGWGTTGDLLAYDGTNVDGTASFTYSDGTEVWIWRAFDGHPDSRDGWGTWYGGFEDEHGKGIYFIHKVDPDVRYDQGGTNGYNTSTVSNVYPAYPLLRYYEYAVGDPVDRVINSWNGQIIIDDTTDGDDIIPICRPVYYQAGVSDLDTLIDSDIGIPIHSKQFEQSDTALSGPPTDFWPRLYTRWTPRGNATKNPSLNNHFFISRV
jgi:hypothetical protein